MIEELGGGWVLLVPKPDAHDRTLAAGRECFMERYAGTMRLLAESERKDREMSNPTGDALLAAGEPCAAPGLTVEERIDRLFQTGDDDVIHEPDPERIAAALRAAIEDCALVAEGMASGALIATRIRALKGEPA